MNLYTENFRFWFSAGLEREIYSPILYLSCSQPEPAYMYGTRSDDLWKWANFACLFSFTTQLCVCVRT